MALSLASLTGWWVLGLFLLLLCGQNVILAQSAPTVEISVVTPMGDPLPFSTIDVTPGQARFTSEVGHYSFSAQEHSTYKLRVKHLGFAAFDTTITTAEAPRYMVKVIMQPVAFHLATVSVRGKTSCNQPGEGTELSFALEQLQQNAERDLLLRNEYPFEYRLARAYDTFDPSLRRSVVKRDTVSIRSESVDRYVPGNIIRRVNNQGRSPLEVRFPVLSDLADSVFLRSHCFSFGGPAMLDKVPTYRINFRPAASIGKNPDFEGSAYLDAKSYMIKRAEFSMTNSMRVSPPVAGLRVTTTYKEIFPGLAVLDHIRGVEKIGGALFGGADQVDDQKLLDVVFDGGKPAGH